MASVDPLSGLTVYDQNDAATGGAEIGAVTKGVAPLLHLIFTNTADRDAKVGSWVAAGGALRKGMRCYTQSEDQEWYYTGAAWTWPKQAKGELAYVVRTTGAGPVPSSSGYVSVSGLSASITIPSARKIRATYQGQVVSDQANTNVGIKLLDSSSGAFWQGSHEVSVANVQEQLTVILRESLTAGTYSFVAQLGATGAGSGFTTNDGSFLLIEDMGGV